MADEFQGEVCGGNWWINSSRSMFGSSPCSSGILDLGSSGWPTDSLDMKARSSDDQSGSANSDGSIVIRDLQKPNRPDLGSNNSNISVDSTLQFLGTGLSSPTTTVCDRTLMHGSNGRSDQSNYQPMLKEDHNSSMNYRQERGVDDCPANLIQKDWSCNSSLKNNFSTIFEEDSSINSFKSSGNQPLNSITASSQCTASFPISSVSYGYSSTLLQTLFDSEPQPQQSLDGNRLMNYPSTTSYQNEFSPTLPKFFPLPKLQNTNSLQVSTNNNPNFCNGSAASLHELRASSFPSGQSQFSSSTFNEKPNQHNLTAKANNVEAQGLGSVAKKISEPAFKSPRIETFSPLPTFKVRKEKLGDRITALQQLVSPFGKTDTASVLHEAFEYIKFLHEQVNVLSTPYLRSGSPIQRQQNSDKVKDKEGSKEDLKSRGLCLVPISNTFPVAAETTTDFWAPSYG